MFRVLTPLRRKPMETPSSSQGFDNLTDEALFKTPAKTPARKSKVKGKGTKAKASKAKGKSKAKSKSKAKAAKAAVADSPGGASDDDVAPPPPPPHVGVDALFTSLDAALDDAGDDCEVNDDDTDYHDEGDLSGFVVPDEEESGDSGAVDLVGTFVDEEASDGSDTGASPPATTATRRTIVVISSDDGSISDGSVASQTGSDNSSVSNSAGGSSSSSSSSSDGGLRRGPLAFGSLGSPGDESVSRGQSVPANTPSPLPPPHRVAPPVESPIALPPSPRDSLSSTPGVSCEQHRMEAAGIAVTKCRCGLASHEVDAYDALIGQAGTLADTGDLDAALGALLGALRICDDDLDLHRACVALGRTLGYTAAATTDRE